MKTFFLLLIALAVAAANATAARMTPATGRIVDEQGQAVVYATVVLLHDTEQVAGVATDADGRFSLKVPSGDYTLLVQYLGYEPVRQQIRVNAQEDLGDIALKSSTTDIEGVVVKAQLIRREADRFVVDVANSPAAAGRDGIELLERAPGVWLDNDKISINGKSGSKVYVNDRELKLEPQQLLNYIKQLRAEEIQKIEVIPTTGADYDANSSGGIIRITLKKRRENGIDGSLSMNTSQGELRHEYRPSGSINLHSGRTDVSFSTWGDLYRSKLISNENTHYTANENSLTSHSQINDTNNRVGLNAGVFQELSAHHSIGIEAEYWHEGSKSPNDTYADFTSSDLLRHTDSRYNQRSTADNGSVTFNYIWKIDTLGSTLKFLADYTQLYNDSGNGNRSRTTLTPGGIQPDSIYRDNSTSRYQITTATLALDKRFSPQWSLKAGVKYTYNDMRNRALYEYEKADAWLRNDNQSFDINYTENIAAAYGIASASLGRWNVVAGLRGEYTHTVGKGHDVGQNYGSLFPNANISYSLSKDGAYSLIAQYARTIERPSFWRLNPQRTQISDYMYQTGNPSLNAAYNQEISLTVVLKHKYTLTGGITLQSDEIEQTIRPDRDNPNLLELAWVNFDRTRQYYLSANLPFQFTKWWQLNAYASYVRQGQRIEQHGKEVFNNGTFINLSTTFTLPAKFYIDLSCYYQSRVTLGNVWMDPTYRLQMGLKKQFGEHFTASVSIRNPFDPGQTVGARGDGFVRKVKIDQAWTNRTFRIGLVYNFKSGKAFSHKTVEASSADEKSRLQ